MIKRLTLCIFILFLVHKVSIGQEMYVKGLVFYDVFESKATDLYVSQGMEYKKSNYGFGFHYKYIVDFSRNLESHNGSLEINSYLTKVKFKNVYIRYSLDFRQLGYSTPRHGANFVSEEINSIGIGVGIGKKFISHRFRFIDVSLGGIVGPKFRKINEISYVNKKQVVNNYKRNTWISFTPYINIDLLF
jgi:hypothetical protein